MCHHLHTKFYSNPLIDSKVAVRPKELYGFIVPIPHSKCVKFRCFEHVKNKKNKKHKENVVTLSFILKASAQKIAAPKKSEVNEKFRTLNYEDVSRVAQSV
jgi:hypothetical protein